VVNFDGSADPEADYLTVQHDMIPQMNTTNHRETFYRLTRVRTMSTGSVWEHNTHTHTHLFYVQTTPSMIKTCVHISILLGVFEC